MPSKVLFFDIDGVLNLHEKLPGGACGISPDLRDNFNRIVDAHPDIRFVLHSAWRYLIHCGDMTLGGMGYLLQTHGLKMYDNGHRLIGLTSKDVYHDGVHDRPLRIREWLNNSGLPIGTRFAIIDDLPLAWCGPEFFHCPNGLTHEIADQIIRYLSKEACDAELIDLARREGWKNG